MSETVVIDASELRRIIREELHNELRGIPKREWVNIKQAAELMSISEKTLRKRLSAGETELKYKNISKRGAKRPTYRIELNSIHRYNRVS